MANSNELDITNSFFPKPMLMFGKVLANMVVEMKKKRKEEKENPKPSKTVGQRIKGGFKSFGKNFKNSLADGGAMASMLPPPIQWGLDRLLNGTRTKDGKNKKKGSEEIDSTETVKLLSDQVDNGIELVESSDEEIELLDSLLDYQEQSVDLLKKIDKNTTPDTLKSREDEIENRKKAARLFGGAAANDESIKGGKGGVGGIISGIVGDLLSGAVAGWLGAKGLKGAKGIFGGKGAATAASGVSQAAKKPGFFKRGLSSMKGVPGLVAKAVTGTAALAAPAMAGAKAYLGNTSVVKNSSSYLETLKDTGKGVLASAGETAKPVTSAIASGAQKAKDIGGNVAEGGKTVISTLSDKASKMFGGAKNWLANTGGAIADGASDVAKATPGFLDKAKNIGAKGLKALGMPLTVATTLYDVNEVASDDKLNDSQKNKEYTKIGTKLAGMWAGAKAGAAVGAMGGGAVGAAFGGVGAAPGAAVGGIVGGIAGAFGGYELGDVVGEKIGNAAFDTKSNVSNPDNITVESIIPEPAKATQKIQTALRLGGDSVPKSVSDYINNVGNQKFEDVKNDYYSYLTKQGLEFDDNTAINAIAKVKQDSLQNKAKIEKLDTFANLKYSDPMEAIKKVANSASAIPNISTKNEYEDVTVGETRNTTLQSLSNELEENNLESSKPTVIQQPIILPNPSGNGGGGNGGSINTGESGNRTKLGIPNTRNQDGTLERLLNFTYRPLLD